MRSQTNVVLVDLRVSDKAGHLITDLKQSDFRVYEDGNLQTVTSFSFENIEHLAQATAESGPAPTIDLGKLPPNVSPVKVIQDHRLIVLFFDLSSMQVDDLMRALKSATDFVHSRLTPADLIAVVTYSSSLRVLQNFSNDRDTLNKALDRIRIGESSSLAQAGSEGEAGTTNLAGQEVVVQDVSAAFTPDETEFNIFNTDEKLAAVESLAQMLRDIPGRKSVLHFSSGVQRTGVENQAQLRATIDAANQANVSLYAVDARGLVALPPGGDASSASPAGTALYTGQAHFSQRDSLQDARETLASLATDTGGKMFSDLNDFSQAFEEIQSDNSSYYLIGYTPTNKRSDGRFRRIRVEVMRSGVKVTARPGYFAPKNFRQFTREDKELQLEEALDLDAPFVDEPFVVETAYFRRPDQRYYVLLAAKIPGSAVSFLQRSATRQTEFDFAWRATDASGRTVAALRDTLPVKLTAGSYEMVLKGNLLYEGGIVLAPGKYRLKVVVRENQSGKLGTFEGPLALPEITDTGLALSSVILSNELQEASASGDHRRGRGRQDKQATDQPLAIGHQAVMPSVTRVFRTNQKLYIYLESYAGKLPSRANAPAAASAASLPPAVGLTFFRGGVKIAESGPFPRKLEESSSDRAAYFAEMTLEKFPPGRYWLQVNVIDPRANRVAFARVPLAIIKAPVATPAAHAGK